MDITTALLAQLGDLTADNPRDAFTINDSLATLTRDLKLAVRSFVGLEVTLSSIHQPITLTSFDADTSVDDIATSLRWPLADHWSPTDHRFPVGHWPPARGESQTPITCTVTFYASVPGAFVDLAADLAYALGTSGDALVLDHSPAPATLTSQLVGQAELSVLNRALGVLIDQGHHPDQAYHELDRQAANANLSLHTYATNLLTRISAAPPPHP